MNAKIEIAAPKFDEFPYSFEEIKKQEGVYRLAGWSHGRFVTFENPDGESTTIFIGYCNIQPAAKHWDNPTFRFQKTDEEITITIQ